MTAANIPKLVSPDVHSFASVSATTKTTNPTANFIRQRTSIFTHHEHDSRTFGFPDAKVQANKGTDYKYRAKVPRETVAKALYDQAMAVAYPNFKGAVKARKRHDAYMGVWSGTTLCRIGSH